MRAARRALLAAAIAAAAGCEDKHTTPVQRGAAPLREVSEISSTKGNNPAPVVDPTGSVQTYKGAKHELGCENNLRQLFTCLQAYASTSGNYPPAGALYKTLFEASVLTEPAVCAVPRSGVSSLADVLSGKRGVYRTTMDALNDSTPTDKPIVWDPEPMEGGRHVLRFGGSVEVMSEEQLNAALARFEGKQPR